MSKDTSTFASVTKPLYCHRSGVLLAELNVFILEGHMAYVQQFDEAVKIHPFYAMDSTVVIRKMRDCLAHCDRDGWVLTVAQSQRLSLLMSALLWSMDCIKQDRATLPPQPITVGFASKVLNLAEWYWNVSSQRLSFPIYSISERNDNLDWGNFKFWINSAFEVRHEWGNKSRELRRLAAEKAREEALKDIKSEAMKRIDVRKVWNWLSIQLEKGVPKGRIETFKSLFIDGDIEYLSWTSDDIDDLQEAMSEYCNTDHEIMFFIRKRLEGIRALIRELYSGFTLLNRTGGTPHQDGMTEKEAAIFDDYDKRAAALESMPPEPQRNSFMTMGLYMKALAEWRILERRFKLQDKKPGESK